jgi:hypothetical protein
LNEKKFPLVKAFDRHHRGRRESQTQETQSFSTFTDQFRAFSGLQIEGVHRIIQEKDP